MASGSNPKRNELNRLRRDLARDETRLFFSANGTFLCQPRVQRREGNERRETLGYELEIGDGPKGAALTVGVLYDFS